MEWVKGSKLRFVLALFAVLFGLLLAQPVGAETLIYNNSVDSGYYYPPGSYNEVVDYGTSSGGNVTKFTIGYFTASSNPGTITIRFYRWVNEYTDPDDATFLKRFGLLCDRT